MKKDIEKEAQKKTKLPMFSRYLRGPELEQVKGGFANPFPSDGGGGNGPANSSTHNGDFDY